MIFIPAYFPSISIQAKLEKFERESYKVVEKQGICVPVSGALY